MPHKMQLTPLNVTLQQTEILRHTLFLLQFFSEWVAEIARVAHFGGPLTNNLKTEKKGISFRVVAPARIPPVRLQN